MTLPAKRIIATAMICLIAAMFIHMKARMSVGSQVVITIIPLAIILMSPMTMTMLCGAGGLFEIVTAADERNESEEPHSSSSKKSHMC